MRSKSCNMKLTRSKKKSASGKTMPAKRWTICAACTRKLFKVYSRSRTKNLSFWRRRRLSWLKIRQGLSTLKKRNWHSFRKLTQNREISPTRRALKAKRSFTQSNMILWGSSCNRNGKWTNLQKKLTRIQVKAIPQFRSCQLSKRQNSNVVKKKFLCVSKPWQQGSVPLTKKRSSLSNENASCKVGLMRSRKGRGRLLLSTNQRNKRSSMTLMKRIYSSKRRTEESEILPSTWKWNTNEFWQTSNVSTSKR